MNAIRRRLHVFFALSTVCSPGLLRAAAVEAGSLPGLGMVRTVPAFRAAVLDQITIFSSMGSHSIVPAPSLNPSAPKMTSYPTIGQDPVRAAAERLVGALVAQPQVIARHQEELLAALGAQGAGQLKEASARLEQRAAENVLLAAQLKDYRQRLDLGNAKSIEEFGARLNALFENSKSRPEGASGGAVTAADSAPKQEGRPASWKLRSAPVVLPKLDFSDRVPEARRPLLREVLSEHKNAARVLPLVESALKDYNRKHGQKATLADLDLYAHYYHEGDTDHVYQVVVEIQNQRIGVFVAYIDKATRRLTLGPNDD